MLRPSVWCRLMVLRHRGPQWPPPLHFLNPLVYPSPALSKSSPDFCSEWKQVNYEIEFLGIWPVQPHPLFLFFPREGEIKQKQVRVRVSAEAEYQPLCLFSPTENTPLFSHWRGMWGKRGKNKTCWARKITICLNNLLACAHRCWLVVAWFNSIFLHQSTAVTEQVPIPVI